MGPCIRCDRPFTAISDSLIDCRCCEGCEHSSVDLTVLSPCPVDSGHEQRVFSNEITYEVGQWCWLLDKEGDGRRLGCVVRVGSNYVGLKGVVDDRSEWSCRVHFDEVSKRLAPAPDAVQVIRGKVDEHQGNVRRLMKEVQALTARLGVGERAALAAGGEVGQLVVATGPGPVREHKALLLRAKDRLLPDLFKEIGAENKAAAAWMKAELIPLEAESEGLLGLTEKIEGRIFNVELYAGLCEELVEVRPGAPAEAGEQVCLMQRLCYMDEECLAAYEVGGMEFGDLPAFEAWLSRPENFSRIFPFPRTAVAFRVRRERKEREAVVPSDLISIMFAEKADKKTFLYFRNGQQLWRLSTGIEFGAQLFPEAGSRVIDRGEIYADVTWSSVDPEKIISRGHYEDMVRREREEEARYEEWRKKSKEERAKAYMHHPMSESHRYVRCTPETVYYDDILRGIAEKVDEHNRLVLVLQGVLDRSLALHPHPSWRLWTPEGFASGVRLVCDDSRALAPGDLPDFEAYRARCNATLKVGSVTVGQEVAWEVREAERYNDRRDRSGRTRGETWYPERYRPDGDPGPGRLASVVAWQPKSKRCSYRWDRESRQWCGRDPAGPIGCAISVPSSELLNVDAYVPGDWKIFFQDPRTRAQYLKWAPLLLEAEEWHAGNRKLGGSLKRR